MRPGNDPPPRLVAPMSHNAQLRITEIFFSLQGESSSTGKPTVFVRLTGCPLRCKYCDTAYAFSGGRLMDLQEVEDTVAGFSPRHVTVTGGEPLAQPQCLELLRRLCDLGYEVSLETGGALPVVKVDPRTRIVMDLKTPGSKEAARNLEDNVRHLGRKDEIKFVICDRTDYEWAKSKILQLGLTERVGEILLSPSFGELSPRDLAEWILADRLRVRMQLQLHKSIWGEEAGH